MRPRLRLGPIVLVLLALLLAPFGSSIGALGGMLTVLSTSVTDAATDGLPAGVPLCRTHDTSAPAAPPAHRTACRHCPACLLPLGPTGLLAAAPTAPPPRRSWDVAAMRPDPRPLLIPARLPSGFARAPPVA